MYQLPPIFYYTLLTETRKFNNRCFIMILFPPKRTIKLSLQSLTIGCSVWTNTRYFKGILLSFATPEFFCKVMSIPHRLCFVTGWWIWNEMHQICILQCKWNVMSECKWARILLYHTFLVADMWWMFISCFIILFEIMLIFVI